MSLSPGKLRRYNLVLPEALFDEIKQIADRQQTTVVEIIRRFMKLGLLATQIEEAPESELIIRENGAEQKIILL